MTEAEYKTFRHEAIHQLMDLNESNKHEFSISQWPRWDYELNDGTLVFSEGERPRVVANIQVVGTTDRRSDTWMWGWANEHLPNLSTKELVKVKEFGSAESILELTTELLPDEEHLGWELTAVAAKVLGAKGAYCCPGDNGDVYLIYTSIRKLQDGEVLPSRTESDRGTVECATHGDSYSTFLCEHLATDPAQEWFSADPDEDNPWPDAWCAECDAIYREQGEWNDANEGRLTVKLLCHHCYEAARAQATK